LSMRDCMIVSEGAKGYCFMWCGGCRDRAFKDFGGAMMDA